MVQLCRFSNQVGQLVKDENFFSCAQNESRKFLTVLITIEDEVSFTSKYSFIATRQLTTKTINHCYLTTQVLRMGSLLGFYQGLTLIFLVLLECQIGF